MKLERATFGRLIRFVGVAAVGFPLNLMLTVLVHEVLGASEELAFAVALGTLFVFYFFASRYFTFQAGSGDPRRQLLKYAVFSALFRIAEFLGFLVLHTFFNIQYMISAVVILGTSFFLKFYFYADIVFTQGRKSVE
jgi:putative flippase GtrA